MNLFDVFGQAFWRQLVFALLHTLWQGGLIALATATALRYLPARNPGARYLLALTAQFGVLIAGLLTWAALGYEPPRPINVRTAGVENVGVPVVAISGGAWNVQPPVENPRQSEAGNWVAFVAVVWLAGVVLMMARAAGSAMAAAGLTRGAGAVDRAILDAVERLRTEMGIARRIRVVACERCPGPAVLGLVWPTVVLPVSMMTGLNPEAIRAILAHELAHIQRFDYLVNLAQMLVEALLFFNPAVWWLGRQARIEREACCDAVAVRLTGRPLEYSRVLADWAERVRAIAPLPGVALGWAQETRPSTLRERVLRVLKPGDTPTARLSWTGLAVLLVVGPLVVFALRQGADRAVNLAAQVLSPTERVEKLKQAKAEFAAPETSYEGKTILKGRLHAPGGKPLPKPVEATAMSRAGQVTFFASLKPLEETFSVEVHPGMVWLALTPEEFAPVLAGPFEAKSGATIEGIDVVFEPGFAARIRVIDENGKPVAGASVNGGLVASGSSTNSLVGLVTDADGVVTIAHAARGRYSLSAKAKGLQSPVSREVTLTPGEATTLSVVHARPTSGVVVGPDEAPVAGAKIRPFARYKPQHSQQYGATEPIIATTNGEGRFRLDALDDDSAYSLLIESDRLGRRLVNGVRAGQKGLKWTVGPDLTISGTVKGDISVLEKDHGKPFVVVSQGGGETDGMSIPSTSTNVPIEPAEGGGRFRITGVLPGKVAVAIGRHVVALDVQKPENPVTIDLTAPVPREALRQVMLRIVTPEGADRATGSIVGYASDTGPEPSFRHYEIPLQEGTARFEIRVPGHFSYQSRSVVGYWFKDGDVEVPLGDSPMVVEVPAVPAGAIVGRVLEADGKPASQQVSLGATFLDKPPVLKPDDFLNLNNFQVDSGGRFFVGPLPIGGTYYVVAGRGHNRQISTPVKLDGSTATVSVELRLARPVAGGGRVVGPDGQPIAGVPVTLTLNHRLAGTTWGPPATTNRDGTFQFDDLSPELGPYGVTIDTRKEFVPVEATLNPGGPAIEIRLKRGRVVSGRVVDAKTGWPIPGVEFYVTPKQRRPGERSIFEPEAPADDQGRFRFSNLPAGELFLNDRSGLRWEESKGVHDLATDRTTPVEVRGTLPAWSKLKPIAP